MGIASNDNDYPEEFATCDYCGKLENKPHPFWDARTQMSACSECIRNVGLLKLVNWVDSLPDIRIN